jgi:hypothetical protein
MRAFLPLHRVLQCLAECVCVSGCGWVGACVGHGRKAVLWGVGGEGGRGGGAIALAALPPLLR